MHKELFEKHATALAAGGAEPRIGVNLGGWLCEEWMQESLFSCCGEDDGGDEFHVAVHLEGGHAGASQFLDQ